MEYSTSAPGVKNLTDSTPSVVASLLKALRRETGLRQHDLALLLGRSQSYVSKYENSQRRLDIIELLRICEALGVTFVAFASLLEAEMKT